MIPAPLTKWNTVAQLCIEDTKLGVLNLSLIVCVLSYLAATIVHFKQYRWEEEPGGSTNFWFERPDEQDVPAASANTSFCDNPAYDHNYYPPPSYWSETDIGCDAFSPGEMVVRSGDFAFASTLVKKTNFACDACKAIGDTCDPHIECTTNSFVLGVEDVGFSVEHTVSTSSVVGGFEASSALKARRGDLKLMRTCVKRKSAEPACNAEGQIDVSDQDRCCYRMFAPGDTMTLKISEWLEAAGVNLDEKAPNTEFDAITGIPPFRRLTGVRLHVHLNYFADEADDVVMCEAVVVPIEGWSSFGAKPIYTSYHGVSIGSQAFDNYKRGVRFEFRARGRVTRFDTSILLESLIAGIVLLRCIPHVMRVVAKHCVAEKSVYKRAIKDVWEYKRIFVQFAIQVAVTCQAFKDWDVQSDGSITKEELTDVFRGCLDEAVSCSLANLILVEGADHDLTCRQLVQMMSDGFVEIDQFRKYSERHLSKIQSLRSSSKDSTKCTAAAVDNTRRDDEDDPASDSVSPSIEALSAAVDDVPAPARPEREAHTPPLTPIVPIYNAHEETSILPNTVRSP